MYRSSRDPRHRAVSAGRYAEPAGPRTRLKQPFTFSWGLQLRHCPAEQTRCAGLHGTTGGPEPEAARDAAYQTFIGLSTRTSHRAYG